MKIGFVRRRVVRGGDSADSRGRGLVELLATSDPRCSSSRVGSLSTHAGYLSIVKVGRKASLPYLKLVGSLLLLWVGIKLLLPESEDPLRVRGNSDIFSAIKTIVIADLTMSLDNVLGVAAVANGHFILLIIGLFVSVPLVIYGSTLIAKLMARFSFLIILGAAFIGYIAGKMAVSEDMVRVWLQREISPHYSSYIPFATAVLVILIGKWIAAKQRF